MIEAYGFGKEGKEDKMWRLVYYEIPRGKGTMFGDGTLRFTTEKDFIASIIGGMVLYA